MLKKPKQGFCAKEEQARTKKSSVEQKYNKGFCSKETTGGLNQPIVMSPEATTTSFSELVVGARTCSLVKLGGDLTKGVQEIGPIFGDSIVTVAKLKAIRSGYTIMLE